LKGLPQNGIVRVKRRGWDQHYSRTKGKRDVGKKEVKRTQKVGKKKSCVKTENPQGE